MKFPFRFAGKNYNINLWGKVDKIILTQDNEFAIIDYKTGRINKRSVQLNPKIKNTNADEEFYYNPERIKLLQLMLYKFLLMKSPKTFEQLNLTAEPTFENIQSGYWSFQNLDEGFINFTNHNFATEKDFVLFMEDFLRNVLRNMIDPNIPIEEKPNILKSLRRKKKVA
jgi:ATP-dependent exoDNAse (exonuclease V) beta subunit